MSRKLERLAMKTRKELKARAKAQLKGKWGAAALFTFVYVVISAVTDLLVGDTSSMQNWSVFNWIFWVASYFVTAGLSYALAYYALQLAKGKNADLSAFSVGFRNIGRAWWMQVVYAFFMSLTSLLPSALFFATDDGALLTSLSNFSQMTDPNQMMDVLATIAPWQFIIVAVMLVIEIIVGLLLSQAWFVMVDNERLGAVETLQTSWRIMKGYLGQYFMLSLSFIGWMIVGVATCGLGFFWILPYMAVTLANFYQEIRPKWSKDA